MTPGSIRFLALAALASLPLMAQQTSPSPQPPEGGNPQARAPQQTNPEPGASQNSIPNEAPVPRAGNSPDVFHAQLRPVTGELESNLDTSNAKNGDSVVVKTTETATTANGMEIPKGSEIKGHIVGVAAKGQEGPNSRVAIQFDQAQLQTGQNLQIRSVIQSVAPAGMTGSQLSGSRPNPPAGSSPSPGANPAAPGQAGDPPAPGTVVATRGNLAIKTTAIPGVLLIGDVNGRPSSDAAGALLGANRDVHLDGGTVMVVAIMTAPPAVGTR